MKTKSIGIATLIAGLSVASAALASECERLDPPKSYRNPKTKAYLLAVDACQSELFAELGFIERKKPSKQSYANEVREQFGFPNNAFYYSDRLGLTFEAPTENNVFSRIIEALGFRRGMPAKGVDYPKSDRDLVREVQICCDPDSKVRVACSAVSLKDYYSSTADYSNCD